MAAGILDTNALILLERLDPARPAGRAGHHRGHPGGAVVGPLVATDDHERAARQARLQEVESVFEPLPFDASAARAFGRVAASLRRSGRKPAARAFDALIAATAVANQLALYTCNPRDYEGIDGLEVVELTPAGS